MSRLFRVLIFSLSVLGGECFLSSSTWSVAFLRADTQAGALRVELHFWRCLQAFVQVCSMGSMASMGKWGFPAASVSCSAIMHWPPLNRIQAYHRKQALIT
jgi:hypothetical protein